MTRAERETINRDLFQQKLDCWLVEYLVSEPEFVAYVSPQIPADLLWDADTVKREVARFSRDMRRIR